MLLHGFPLSANTDPHALIGAYLLACEGERVEAMLAACRAYLQGKVKRQDSRFAPSAAEFAEQVRYQQLVLNAETRKRPAEAAPMLEPPKPVDPVKLSLFARMSNGDQEAKRELQELITFNMDDMADLKRVLGK